MIVLMGHVQVDASDADGFLVDVRALAGAARARDGCRFYSVAPEEAGAGRMLVVERWRDQAALTAHLEARDTVAFVAKWASRMQGDVLKYDAANERSLMA